jgi:1-acyl-sn-glycerol-3-phosphate acyltransferase
MNRMSPSPASGIITPLPSPTLGPAVPQHRGPVFKFVGHLILRLAGWRITGSIPDLPQFVVIVAPHTSNWDFPVGLAAKWALGFRVKFLGKDTLFKPPLGWFMRAIGGIPVNRKTANALVDRSAQEFTKRSQLVLVLAPEGTRFKVDKWRSGFWHIARTADVPIVCAAIDWGTKQVRFGPTLTVQKDAEPSVDIARIKAHYDDTRGYHPALQA